MYAAEFDRKYSELEKKIAQFEELKSELDEFRSSLDTRIRRNATNSKKIIEEYLRATKVSLKSERTQLAAEKKDLLELRDFVSSLKRTDREAAETLLDEKTKGFPWLASAWADYLVLRDEKLADYMDRKSPPAHKSADIVRKCKKDKRRLEKLSLVTKYLLDYYEALFPWLTDFKEDDVDELLAELLGKTDTDEEGDDVSDYDRARDWLTPDEYNNLPNVEKYQRALDNYWNRRKRSWQIGRDYERYVGYLYERNGFDVYYQGIFKGLEDLGRDLICKKDGRVEVVQCKYWAKTKMIHEKHINQLFGTTVMYYIQQRYTSKGQMELFPDLLGREHIVPCFHTSTFLSKTSKEFADALGVKYVENCPLDRYPSIKCNISRRTGEKIYHLPFDQQYDNTVVERERHEMYVETVAEAEQFGFRRAFRWKGTE